MVYGEEALQKSYSCRFHYTQRLNNLLKKIPSNLGELRSEVDTLGREWCRVSTLSEDRVGVHRTRKWVKRGS